METASIYDEKTAANFAEELSALLNKYKVSLTYGKEGLLIQDAKIDHSCIIVTPKSATDNMYSKLIIVGGDIYAEDTNES